LNLTYSSELQWITVDSRGIHCNPLENIPPGQDWNSYGLKIPVKSENLADVECFSSSGFIPVEYSGIQLELVGDMKDLEIRRLDTSKGRTQRQQVSSWRGEPETGLQSLHPECMTHSFQYYWNLSHSDRNSMESHTSHWRTWLLMIGKMMKSMQAKYPPLHNDVST